MTGRRDFVKTLGAAALGYAVRPRAPSPDSRPPVRTLNRIGLELYSVRDAMGRDPDGTLAAVRAMGYTDVELLWSFGNFGRSTEQVRAALDREGLRAPSAHISPISLFVGWNRSLEIAHRLGHEYLIVRASPGRPPARSTTGGIGPIVSIPPGPRRVAPASGSPSTTKPITCP